MTTASRGTSAKGFVRRGDKVFTFITTLSGVLILVILVLVAVFLLNQSSTAILADGSQISAAASWIKSYDSIWSYVGPLVFGTVLASVLALVLAVPISIGISLFISHYAPRRLAQVLGYMVDLLAAVPSVVFGLWGGIWLVPRMEPAYELLNKYLGFIPLFGGTVATPARNIMSAALVLTVMILPIITAVVREVFLQTPKLHEEAALALGATRWEMIRMAVFPFARSGIISGSMLGLGRALGETMAVLMVLSPGMSYSWHIFEAGQHQTIASNIAANQPEASGLAMNILIFTGLVLFVITLIVNMLARWIISRRAEFSGAN